MGVQWNCDTFDVNAKISLCVAENERDNPWSPQHVERRHAPVDTVVTVLGCEDPHNIQDHGSLGGLGVLTPWLARSDRRAATTS